MIPLAVATALAAVAALAAVLWTLYVLFDIGSDGLGAGPWKRPGPNQTHSRLPSDFVGLWSLFGSKSINALAGSRESAVRRLDRLEAQLRGQRLDPDDSTLPVNPVAGGLPNGGPGAFEDGWLERRLDELERLAGMRLAPSPAQTAPAEPPTVEAATRYIPSPSAILPSTPARGRS